MASGPSKQELEMYWQSSRQYFDELAEHYKKNDPAYYKEFIQPFYSNPFRAGGETTAGKKSGCGPRAVFAVALLVVIAGLAAAVFLLMNDSDDKSTDRKKDTQFSRDSVTGIEPPPAPDKIEPEEESPETSIHYRRGVKLFEQKEYKLAGRYLRNVPKNDPNYQDAQRMLKIIEAIDKKDERKKPIERIR